MSVPSGKAGGDNCRCACCCRESSGATQAGRFLPAAAQQGCSQHSDIVPSRRAVRSHLCGFALRSTRCCPRVCARVPLAEAARQAARSRPPVTAPASLQHPPPRPNPAYPRSILHAYNLDFSTQLPERSNAVCVTLEKGSLSLGVLPWRFVQVVTCAHSSSSWRHGCTAVSLAGPLRKTTFSQKCSQPTVAQGPQDRLGPLLRLSVFQERRPSSARPHCRSRQGLQGLLPQASGRCSSASVTQTSFFLCF